jgi:hypothetical protein
LVGVMIPPGVVMLKGSADVPGTALATEFSLHYLHIIRMCRRNRRQRNQTENPEKHISSSCVLKPDYTATGKQN